MHQAYIELNGVQTKITTWGRWIEESSSVIEDIVIIVTGNPGVSGFYDLFAKTIHEKLGYSVWCIGHAGHDLPPTKIPLPKLKTHGELYGLQGQIKHKNIRALIKPGVLRRVFFLAFEEMDQVKQRNDEAIKRNIKKIKLYYGMNDGWAPGSFCDRIKTDIPNIDAQVCPYDHVFVFKNSVEIADIVSDWIKAKQ
ncbi:hypothetical protein NQ318_007949 [Aromia moschata]|uniref:Lipid droplet-associated hydrolase n=1 Tax=Aromia moschata TaxID=1265417 RepID=A0AAV8YDB5_9CUCU|nr:hypothetical protein NQ318_007949 [Aromia moschata]